MRALREVEIQRAVVDLLTAYGWQVHRLQAGLAVASGKVIRLGEKGQPDLLAIRAKQRNNVGGAIGLGGCDVVYIEVKTQTGRLRADQEVWIRSARRRGLAVIVVRSVDDLAAELARIGINLGRDQ